MRCFLRGEVFGAPALGMTRWEGRVNTLDVDATTAAGFFVRRAGILKPK